MFLSRRATKTAMLAGFLLGAAVAASGCGGVSAGDPCEDKGEQACSDNKEMVCGEDMTWVVAEDCGSSKTCVINGGGDADCE